jgi:hypothetical protein
MFLDDLGFVGTLDASDEEVGDVVEDEDAVGFVSSLLVSAPFFLCKNLTQNLRLLPQSLAPGFVFAPETSLTGSSFDQLLAPQRQWLMDGREKVCNHWVFILAAFHPLILSFFETSLQAEGVASKIQRQLLKRLQKKRVGLFF